jgi:hypothetical protein
MIVNEKSEVLTKILEDRSPDEDAFGGHEKVSNAIYELIEDEKEGGKAIALSGGFGSGKSTVIEFLKRIFNKKEKEKQTVHETGIFVFDAWEHQGDPLRRAFIEEYVSFLENNEWIKGGEFDGEIDKISKRQEVIETTTEPIVSKQGGFFALLLLLVPLGLSLVRYGTIDKNLLWINILGFLFILSPIIYVVVLFARFDEKKRQSVFNLFFKKTKENIKSISSKTPDPTTIEFQDSFNEITRRALENSSRRLVVVIDNIDRLTTESSINAWSTLQTFFENDNKKLNWKKQFWLIAPFDLKELENLWRGLDHLKEPVNSDSNKMIDKTADYVQAFLDKTFQVMFRVPQPVLSDWKEYFIKQMGIAFPSIKEHSKNIFNDVATLYQLKGIRRNEAPTPRQIKQFINRVSALYRIWHKKDVKLSTLAYYELIADEENFIEKLKENELVDSTSRFVIEDKELNRKLAAIHFNCDISKAYQVLYGNQIGTALHEGTAKGLEDYLGTEGFLDVLGSEFLSLLGQGVPLSLANSAMCLDTIEVEGDHKLDNYFIQLATSLRQVNSIKPGNINLGKGIAIIWGRTGFNTEWISSILKKISHNETDDKTLSVGDWYSSLEPLFECLYEESALNLLSDNLELPNGPEEYISLLLLIINTDKGFKEEIVKHLNPSATQDQIVERYANLLKSEDISDGLGEAFYLHTLTEEGIFKKDVWDWSELINQIRNQVKVNGATRTIQLKAALKMMPVLCFKYEDDGALSLSKDQNFHNGLFYLINNQNDEMITALLVINSVFFNPNNQKSVNDNNVNKGHNALTNILNKPDDKEFIQDYFLQNLIEFELFEEFFKVQHGNNTLRPLSVYVIEKSFQFNEALDQIDARIVFEYFQDIYQVVDEEALLGHIEYLFEREESLVDLVIEEFETIPSSYEEHYIFAKACPDDLRPSYFEFLIDGYKNLEKEVWLDHLKNETELIQLAILIQEAGYDLGLSVKFKDALEEHYKQVYSGEIEAPSDNLIIKWESFLDALDKDIKSTFLKNIKFYIERKSDGVVSKIGHLYDSILISEGIYLTEADRFISNVFTRVLKSNDEEELTWLKELIQKQPEILEQKKSATKAFKAEIKHLELGDYSDNASKIVDEIALILEVDRSENNDED